MSGHVRMQAVPAQNTGKTLHPDGRICPDHVRIWRLNNMSSKLNTQVLDFVQTAGEALAASRKMAEAEVARQQKIASVVPPQVELLMKSKLIGADEKQAAVNKLSSHEGALEVIGNLVRVLQKQANEHAKTASVQGSGAPTGPQKQGSLSSVESNYVGRRYGSDFKPESDRRFEERLGLS
jgi:hypothetical protein